MPLKPIDYLSIIYFSLVSILIVIFHASVPHWPWYLISHTAYLLLILLIVTEAQRHPHNLTLKFLRYLYPLLASAFVYTSLEGYALIFQGRFLDSSINAWEKSLFGMSPNLWLEHWVSKPLTEYFMFNYFSYYLYLAIPSLVLFLQKRWQDLEAYIFYLMVAFYVAYLGFLIVPAEGPIYSLKNDFAIPRLTGYIFTSLQQSIMNNDPHGTCFPSSHVAVTWTAVWSMGRIFGRKLFWIIFPFAASLTVAVVYNRYHYLVDALAGIFTAFLCYGFCQWLYPRWLAKHPAAGV